MLHRFLTSSLLVCSVLSAQAYDTPTMGWSSWNTYRTEISDSLIKRQADALVELGLDSVGFRYVNIDDGYFGGRDEESGQLLFHPVRFPGGMKPVVDHIHSLGLKAGIYSDAGANTCGNFYDNDSIAQGVGLLGHEEQDCQLFFKDLGFDFIKVDFCGADGRQSHQLYNFEPRERYQTIHKAIEATGRDDVRLNVCRWNYPGTWVSDIAASWRTTHDIAPHWQSVRNIIAENLYLSPYSGGGHFNDMDMLEVGRGMTIEEDQTHFAIWCIMSSPLLIGCDLTTLTPVTLSLLKNTELIALNQDPLAQQAYVAKTDNGTYVLVKDIIDAGGKKRAVALYNPTDTARIISISPSEIELGGKINVCNILSRQPWQLNEGILKEEVPAHGTRVFTLEGTTRLPRTRYEAENAYLSSYQEIYDPTATGTAFYLSDDEASGGMVVANVGHTPSNDLQWRNVSVPRDGEYMINVVVKSGAPGELLIFANNSPGVRLSHSGSGFESLETTLALKKGNNTVRITSAEGAPYIDYMTINL